MNIHEIIHAWENSALPTDLDALAAIESKVDDYANAADEWEEKSKSVLVKGVYMAELRLFYAIRNDVNLKMDQAIDGENNTRRKIRFESNCMEGGEQK